MTSNGEFRGTTKQAILDLQKSVDDMNRRLSRVEKWMWILSGGLLVIGATRFPELVKVVAGGF